jgi:hypothetical protein
VQVLFVITKPHWHLQKSKLTGMPGLPEEYCGQSVHAEDPTTSLYFPYSHHEHALYRIGYVVPFSHSQSVMLTEPTALVL